VDKRRLTTTLAKHLFNPLIRALFRLGMPAPGTAILARTAAPHLRGFRKRLMGFEPTIFCMASRTCALDA
jgi:hypothetical protein